PRARAGAPSAPRGAAARPPPRPPRAPAGLARGRDLVAAAHKPEGWTALEQLPADARRQLNGATGQLLEDLAPIPALLEIRKAA
ncbi:hypothetical protein, partial [Kitasatospora sp. NPDC059803]|uniref:hypothetical protein n=1 Tax=Kitasatospora sp. NPDC059803 TaxID=3346953 RepID=UPI00364FD85F